MEPNYTKIIDIDINSKIYHIHHHIVSNIALFNDIINGNIDDLIKFELNFDDHIINSFFGILYNNSLLRKVKKIDLMNIIRIIDYFCVDIEIDTYVNITWDFVVDNNLEENDIRILINYFPDSIDNTTYLDTYIKLPCYLQKYITKISIYPHTFVTSIDRILDNYNDPIIHLIKLNINVNTRPENSILDCLSKVIKIYYDCHDNNHCRKLLTKIILNKNLLALYCRYKDYYITKYISAKLGVKITIDGLHDAIKSDEIYKKLINKTLKTNH